MARRSDLAYGRHQKLAKKIIQPIFRRLWSINVSGAGNIPTSGPAVLCANHLAAIDSFIVPAVLEREVLYVGKAEYLDDWKTRWIFPALGMIPIDRRGGDHAKAALDTAGSVLSGGGLFAIYPEGTRSRTGKLYRGHTGAARLAVEAGAPIIPIGLVGTADIQPVDVAMPRLFRSAEVRIGAPIHSDHYRSRIGDHAVYRELIDEVMFEIQQLSGQDYVNRYAGDVNKEAAQAAAEAADGKTATIDLGSDKHQEPSPAPVVATVPRRSSADVLVSRPLVPAAS